VWTSSVGLDVGRLDQARVRLELVADHLFELGLRHGQRVGAKLQEAFLQLYRKIGTFRGESAFSTWLHRLSVNVVLMHLRKKSLPVVSLEETTQAGEEDTPKKDFGAEDLALAGSIDRLQLQKAVDDLPPGYRTIFVLHDVEGYEHNEIATIVGCSIGNSKSQLHKARMKLRDLLKMKRVEKAS